MATVNRNVIRLMLIRTELSGNTSWAYQLSNAGGNSGYSFGQAQWDLSANREIAAGLTAQGLFENILRNAKDADGNLIFNKDIDGNGTFGDDND